MTTSAVTDLVQTMLAEDDDAARSYLRRRWIAGSMRTLRRARLKAGLTQQQVADRMNTKQPAIAKLESDTEGGISLRRYIDYLMACGEIPTEIESMPFELFRRDE
jgi:DNA-binding XRE family transcriptional regulator